MRSTVIAILAAMLLLGVVATLSAQDEEEPTYGWTKDVVGNLNFTQTSFSNWEQGGEDSWNWQLDINGKFVNDQEKTNWTTTGKVSYGRTKIGDADDRKLADEINLESVFTYKMSVYVNPYVAVSGLTQITEGFDYEADPTGETAISEFMNPGFFTESVGFGYEPFANFKTRAGLAFKQTVVTDTAYSLRYHVIDEDTGELKKVRNEVGMESVTDYSRKLNDIMSYTTKLKAFTDFESVESIDVDWDNMISAKVAKYISVSFNFKLFYDNDISAKRQLKQVLAAGLTYTFL